MGEIMYSSTLRVVRPVGWMGIFLLLLLLPLAARAEEDAIAFDSEHWEFRGGRVVDHLGRKALVGNATLKDVEFENGVIEVDVAVTGATSYPGIVFRAQSQDDYERVYIRPHRIARYGDSIQYTPSFHGISGWQLYNGDGFTAGATFPTDEWFTLRLEVLGTQARVFIGESDRPDLMISHLQLGTGSGSIGLMGTMDGTAFFSNFRFRATDDLEFPPAYKVETRPGMITRWELSQPLPSSEIDDTRPPAEQQVGDLEWREVTADARGLVDVARHFGRTGRAPDCVFARTTLDADEDRAQRILFGYSDAISVFLNGNIVFRATSAYRGRDASFLGIVGLFDSLYLPLRKGKNELVFLVTEAFGGWGFMACDGDGIFVGEGLRQSWETPKNLATPETVVYDPARDALYVSNYDGYNPSTLAGMQTVARLSMDGEIVEPAWIEGLANPTGMAIHGDRLFVVERRSIAEIDLETRKVTKRHPVPQGRMLNDIAVDADGNVYVSDSGTATVYRLTGDEIEEWVKGAEIERPNGLHVHGKKLIVGVNGDHSLKSIDLSTREIALVAVLEPGIIDGIETDERGDYLVSEADGRLYRVTAGGEVTRLLDTSVQETFLANFAYVPGKKLIVIPTFVNDRVIAYRMVP